jgi:hypothetical protein
MNRVNGIENLVSMLSLLLSPTVLPAVLPVLPYHVLDAIKLVLKSLRPGLSIQLDNHIHPSVRILTGQILRAFLMLVRKQHWGDAQQE